MTDTHSNSSDQNTVEWRREELNIQEKNEKNEQGNNPAPGMNDAGKSSRETAGEPVRESGGGSGQSRGEGGDGNRSGGDGSPAQAPGSGAPGR